MRWRIFFLHAVRVWSRGVRHHVRGALTLTRVLYSFISAVAAATMCSLLSCHMRQRESWGDVRHATYSLFASFVLVGPSRFRFRYRPRPHLLRLPARVCDPVEDTAFWTPVFCLSRSSVSSLLRPAAIAVACVTCCFFICVGHASCRSQGERQAHLKRLCCAQQVYESAAVSCEYSTHGSSFLLPRRGASAKGESHSPS